MRTGWFKFHRQMLDNPICIKDAETFLVWCYILTEAKYEDGERVLFKNEEITLSKGQLLKTTTQIANELHIKEMKVYRILKLLENEKQIVKQTSNKNTLITVINWEKYQSCEEQNEKQMKNECKTNVKPVKDECKTSEKQMKDQCKTNVEPSYYNKEYKKERIEEGEEREEGKNTTIPQGDSTKPKKKPAEEKHKYGEYQHVLLTDRQFEKLVNDYGEFEVHNAIKFLDEYIQMKGYKAKDHNLALRKWVFKAVEEEKNKNNPQQSRGNDYWAGI